VELSDHGVVGQLKPSTFTSVVVETPAALADEAAGIFAAYGALGCEITGSAGVRESGALKRSRLHAYFIKLNQSSLRRVTALLSQAGMLADGTLPQVSRIDDPGWATMWQKRFEPFPIGDRLTIVPPWDRVAGPNRIPIVIQPGQAFGTGHHASTFGVLNILERLFITQRFARVLDVGTGSGILAIAARKLGATQATAIDLDAIALENARENAELNGVARAIRFSAAPLSSIRGRFELITANILSSVLHEMAPRLKAKIKPGGYLILAGILAREADSVVAAYGPELRWLETRADGPWRTLLLQR
jgi:ribosomal protein L11 methyltransferase